MVFSGQFVSNVVFQRFRPQACGACSVRIFRRKFREARVVHEAEILTLFEAEFFAYGFGFQQLVQVFTLAYGLDDTVKDVSFRFVDRQVDLRMIKMFLFLKVGLRSGKVLGVYLVYYSIVRFILEYFRGDAIRGGIGVLSTSQIISIILLPIGIFLTVKGLPKLSKAKEEPEEQQ